jgi:hypothetical protein
MANEIVTEIRLDLDKLKEELLEAQKASEERSKAIGEKIGEKIEEGLKKPFEGMKEKFLELAGVVAAAFTFEKAIEAAKEGEQALNGLNSALAITGTYSEEASEHAQHYAESLQKTTSASHVAIENGMALLVTLGKLKGDGLDKATKASLDLAAAMHIDVESAFHMVAKAASGHVAALNKAGIAIKSTGDLHRDGAKALELLETRFKGLAEMQTNTFAGALTRTKNMFDNLLESVGNVIIKSPLLMAIFKALASAFDEASQAIEKWAANRDIIAELTKAILVFGQGLTTYVVAPLEFAYNTGRVVFEGFKTLIQGALVAIAQAVGFVTGLLAPLSSKFKEVDDAVKTFSSSSEEVLKGFIGDTKTAMDKVFEFPVASKTSDFIAKIEQFVNKVKPVARTKFDEISAAVNMSAVKPTFFSTFAEGFNNATKSMEKSALELGAQVHATINTGVTNSFAAMGAAMVKGQNGMEAFGFAMLGVLGDIAIQFGTTFIGMGVAKSLLMDPTGPLLIAAGASLAVIGGALKAVSGSGGSAAGSASASAPAVPSGGGVAANGGDGTAPTAMAQNSNAAQRGQVGAQVAVHIQGNVFDSKETGMRIADILNDTFANSGAVLATSGQG